MSVDIRRFLTAAGFAAASALVAVTLPAVALAEPAPPPPGPLMPDPVAAVAAPAVPPPGPLVPGPVAAVAAPVPGAPPGSDAPIVQASAPMPEGMPHLASPDALPPGSTMDPAVGRDETPNVSYLKDLWHAVQNQEISGKEALILGLAQRGMNTPYPDQAPGPNVPVAPVAPAPVPTPPAPVGAPPSD